MSMTTTPANDWANWLRRWDAQQQHHIPRREERFRLMLELVGEVAGPQPARVLDLACGPGSITARVLQRFPDARVVAMDADPLLLAIGRNAQSTARRVRWLQADLRDPAWAEQAAQDGTFDAVLSATALHWLPAGDLVNVYRALAGIVRPGGLFLNAEHLDPAPPASQVGQVAQRLRQQLGQSQRGEGESWSEWWEAAQAEPAFTDLLAERARVFHDHPHEERLTARFHEESLLLAGFSESAVFWRYLDDTIVGAIR